LDLKAPLASPALTGTPTSTTATPGTNNTQIATTAYTDAAVAALVDSAPATLNTLDELALALGDDANFATTTATAIGLKAPLSSPALTGTPTAPTASVGTNTTQIATTEFVQVANPTGAVIAFAGSSAPTGWLLCYGQEVAISSNGALYAVVGTTYGSLTNGSGGVGTTHFRLPDLRGRTVAGVDNMGGEDALRLDIANSSGTVVGSQYVTLTSAQSGVPAHSHANTLTNNAVTSGAGSAHAHGNTASFTGNAVSHAHDFTPRWQGSAGVGVNMSAPSYGSPYGIGGGYVEATTITPSGSVTMSNANESAHTHSVTSNVTISNVNNTAANAASAVSLMQPTMVLNYIIKA
jgi:microcystin-dependent protein